MSDFLLIGVHPGSSAAVKKWLGQDTSLVAPADQVTAVLESFAERGLFRAYSKGTTKGPRSTFKMLWHRDQNFELVFDSARKTLTFTRVLPEVPARSSMDREFREWVAERQSDELPDHRRIDARKCSLSCTNKKGDLGITLTAMGAKPDWEYCTRAIVNLVHEVYLMFLNQGAYYTYMIDTFDLDPDHM